MQCPECNSANVQALSLIHAGGVSSARSRSLGVVAGHLAGGAAHSISQTALSASAAPPVLGAKKKVDYLSDLLILFLITLPGSLSILYGSIGLGDPEKSSFWPIVIGMAWTLFFIRQTYLWISNERLVIREHNRQVDDDYAMKMDEWRRTSICFACGRRFVFKGDK